MTQGYSRRAVLLNLGAGGIIAATGAIARPKHAFAQLDSRPWFYLTDDEARWLAAICDVFIPEDDYPSASQAGVVDYIDLQMASPYGQGEGLYLDGPFPEGAAPTQGYQLSLTPAELVRRGIEAARGETDLAALDTAAREAWVEDFSKREAALGDIPAQSLFSELLTLTNEGYFADPIYLGNHDYAGWKMVGFPGAHSYYTEFVDRPTPRGAPPPMGIAHDSSNMPSAPRPITKEG